MALHRNLSLTTSSKMYFQHDTALSIKQLLCMSELVPLLVVCS